MVQNGSITNPEMVLQGLILQQQKHKLLQVPKVVCIFIGCELTRAELHLKASALGVDYYTQHQEHAAV